MFTKKVTVSGNGNYGSGNFTPTRRGTYRWRALYSGDTNNLPVSTACNDLGESVTLGPATPTLTTNASGNTTLGNPITDTATLAGGLQPGRHARLPRLRAHRHHLLQLARVQHEGHLSGNGNYGSGNYTPTRRGTYRWRASYSGDANNNSA